MRLYNTISKTIEELEPIKDGIVGMYACGPTVYDYTHIGHLRKYINDDLLVRALRANNYKVTHVMNITDVGHLSGDDDSGEDKLEKGAKKFGKDVLDIAREFEEDFWKSIKAVNILYPDIAPRATEHIDDQIALIKALVDNGYTYQTDEAIYYDVSKFENYTKLSGQSLDDKITGVRDEVIVDSKKRNPADFAVWFFTVGRFEDHILRWDSPWGEGFPGWHIECSAMSMKYLGFSFDIHTGGIDHIPVHHTNEIAQSEAATGKKFVKYWVHHYHLQVDNEKMSKSLGNIYRISDIETKKISPLAFRYLVMQTHYRSEMNFTWEALDSAQAALDRLYEAASKFGEIHKNTDIEFERDFFDAVNQDLNMPKALSIMWDLLKSGVEDRVKAATLFKMDEILGLKIKEKADKLRNIPQDILELVGERNKLRKGKKFNAADKIRKDLEKRGYILEDEEKNKTRVFKRN